MKYEPAINRNYLITAIHDVYGLQIKELSFIPVGFAAVCYTLRDVHGSHNTFSNYGPTRASVMRVLRNVMAFCA
jgi:hypothetical protein